MTRTVNVIVLLVGLLCFAVIAIGEAKRLDSLEAKVTSLSAVMFRLMHAEDRN